MSDEQRLESGRAHLSCRNLGRELASVIRRVKSLSRGLLEWRVAGGGEFRAAARGNRRDLESGAGVAVWRSRSAVRRDTAGLD